MLKGVYLLPKMFFMVDYHYLVILGTYRLATEVVANFFFLVVSYSNSTTNSTNLAGITTNTVGKNTNHGLYLNLNFSMFMILFLN